MGPSPAEALEPGEFTLHAHCHQHLRNIIINAMQLKQKESLAEELG